jgi:hypothetical protein
MMGDDELVLILRLKLPTLGLGYNCASNEGSFSLAMVRTMAGRQPVEVNVTDLAVPCVPQTVCPRTDNTPPVNPVLKRMVMLELSALADTIVVLFGLVQRNTEATVCEAVGAGTSAV